jgi:hypothetical protein
MRSMVEGARGLPGKSSYCEGLRRYESDRAPLSLNAASVPKGKIPYGHVRRIARTFARPRREENNEWRMMTAPR